MGASVVAGVNAPPVLEPAEHVLDLVPLTIEFAVMFDRLLAVGLRRDAGHDAAFGEGPAKPVGVIALVAEQARGLSAGQAASVRRLCNRSSGLR